MDAVITVVGAGLAGTEAAWQLAEAGLPVRLIEMKPARRSPAHASDGPAELVCSNSLRSANILNAVGLLKEEMRRLGSLVMHAALACRVPAGDALAVDRERFSDFIAAALARQGRIELVHQEVLELPASEAGPTVIATGPLTADALAQDIQTAAGSAGLHFYDAVAPIVAGDSIDRDVVFAASRYGKGASDDYLNCPLDRAQYESFVTALLVAECYPLHPFEEPAYFEGCLPIEVLAARGRDALRFGPMKPVGLADPRTGRRPYAVVQLRKEDTDGQAFNLVGFQTKLRQGDQVRLVQSIPGLGRAELLRHGSIHRNTYLDTPALLDERMRLRSRPHLRFAGQITGVEGYVESAAHGLITARLLAGDLSGRSVPPPPRTCALGALVAHVAGGHRLAGRRHEPENINWSLFPPLGADVPRHDTKRARVRRAFEALEAWARASAIELLPSATAGLELPHSQRVRRPGSNRGLLPLT